MQAVDVKIKSTVMVGSPLPVTRNGIIIRRQLQKLQAISESTLSSIKHALLKPIF